MAVSWKIDQRRHITRDRVTLHLQLMVDIGRSPIWKWQYPSIEVMKPSSQAEPVELWWRSLKDLRVVRHYDIRGAAFAHLSIHLINIDTSKFSFLSWWTKRWLFWILCGLENLPKAQSFICGSTSDSGTIGAHGKMKDPAGVASKICDLFHLRVLPDAELVIDEAMRWEDFSIIRIPLKSTNLRLSLNWLNEAAWLGVPKLYSLISWTATRSKQVSLPWAPSESFHSSFVLSKAETWLSCYLMLWLWDHA